MRISNVGPLPIVSRENHAVRHAGAFVRVPMFHSGEPSDRFVRSMAQSPPQPPARSSWIQNAMELFRQRSFVFH